MSMHDVSPCRIIRAALLALFLVLPAPAGAVAPRIPNDPYFPQQEYLERIGAPTAWATSLGFEGIIVAVIDSGVDIDHPDLRNNIWRNHREISGNGIDDDGNGYIDDIHGWNFVENNNNPRPRVIASDDVHGIHHGTVSAGIIAARADNGEGIAGVTWQTTIMPIRALDSDGTGEPSDVVRAIEYAVNNGAHIINLSFTGSVMSEELRIAVRRAYDRGVFVVAAAGNAPDGGIPTDLDRRPLYPICLDEGADENFVYGVAATDLDDRKASFSNYGAGCVDGSAPGVRFIGTQAREPGNPALTEPYGGYYSGTSLAAPVVSGVAALMKAMNPNLTPKQLTNLLTESAADINSINPEYFGRLGRGRVDAARAVAAVAAMSAPRPGAQVTLTQSLLPSPTPGTLVATVGGAGSPAEVRLFTPDGTFVRGFEAYPAGFRGGASIAVARFSGDLRQTVVTGALAGGAPQVRIFDINGQVIGGFFAYDSAFTGGVEVAAGSVLGGVRDEIITGAGPGGGPHVRVFDDRGNALAGFFAFEPEFRGGISVAVSGGEILAASGPGRVTTVRAFAADGTVLWEAFPFGSDDRRGASVAVAEDALGRPVIVVRPIGARAATSNAPGASGAAGDAATDIRAITSDGVVLPSVPGDTRGVFGSAPGAGPAVTVYGPRFGSGLTFLAYDPRFRGGTRAGVVRLE